MVGIVIVSHSEALAEGVVTLARELGGEELALEAAGGIGEPGVLGTDATRVSAAIERAMSGDGVLVLMDLGSALMSAELAVEMLGEQTGPVVLSGAPLVEGAVAAAACARGGGSLEEVRLEASRALEMKAGQLEPSPDGAVDPGAGSAPLGEGSAPPRAGTPPSDGEGPAPDAEARIPVLNEIGLHARPAALVVELAARYDADLRLSKPGGAGPVSARSLTGLMTLVARQDDELVATATGPQAREALAALEALARDGFGDGVAAPAPAGSPPASAPAGSPPASAPARPAPAEAPGPAPHPPEPGARLQGIAASPGITLEPVRHLQAELAAPADPASQGPAIEWQRLEAARSAARAAMERDRAATAARGAASEAAIFSAHLALLDDEALLARARAETDAGAAAEAAWRAAGEEVAAAWRALDDERLRERAADVQDVSRRVAAALAGHDARSTLEQRGILIVAELTPGDTVALDPELVRGIATAHGTATAHAAILARALGIPAVVGLGPAVLAIPEGTPVLLDGARGGLVVAPDAATAERAQGEIELAGQRRRRQLERAGEPAMTRDGTQVEVSANLGGAGDAAAAVALGADGVGLLRTEFLFLDRPQIPSEDEQAQALAEIATALEGRPLIIRTLDVGADKPLPALPMPPEHNPFLGRRGLRLSLHEPELLATQLRAILRVASEHPVKLMFPMVATAAELEAALAAVSAARAATGVRAPLEVGIMVEVPSAAVLAEQLARQADFFSVGTNDLTQYTMAAERGNELVADLLAGPQPAVLRLVRAVTAGAQAHQRWVGVCGELAGDPAAALLFVGLGVRELSMAPPLVPEVKEALRSVTLAQVTEVAERALDAPDAAAARALAADLL